MTSARHPAHNFLNLPTDLEPDSTEFKACSAPDFEFNFENISTRVFYNRVGRTIDELLPTRRCHTGSCLSGAVLHCHSLLIVNQYSL